MTGSSTRALSPVCLVWSLWQHRDLLRQLVWRDIAQRYRGSVLGLAWSLLTPLLMLLVYTFVFSVVFPSRWGALPQSTTHFALVIFIGLCVHGFFAEVIQRAPGLILAHQNYVKRVVFPLEVLPAVTVCVGVFQWLVSVLVLVAAQWWLTGGLPVSALWLPVVMAPLVLVALGAAWFIAALGVFMRDIAAVVGPFTTVLMFLSPVFYAQEAVPAPFRQWLGLNPLTFIIEQSRAVLLAGQMPDWTGLGIYTALALLVAWAGYVWFQLTKRGFADVL